MTYILPGGVSVDTTKKATAKQMRRIGEYLRKWDKNMSMRDNAVSLKQVELIEGNFDKLYEEYKDVQHLFWSFDMARNAYKAYRKRLLLL